MHNLFKTPVFLNLMKSGELKQAVLSGKIFIHSTNTIYGTGCNILDKETVEKIKERFEIKR